MLWRSHITLHQIFQTMTFQGVRTVGSSVRKVWGIPPFWHSLRITEWYWGVWDIKQTRDYEESDVVGSHSEPGGDRHGSKDHSAVVTASDVFPAIFWSFFLKSALLFLLCGLNIQRKYLPGKRLFIWVGILRYHCWLWSQRQTRVLTLTVSRNQCRCYHALQTPALITRYNEWCKHYLTYIECSEPDIILSILYVLTYLVYIKPMR